ncbi:MAG: CoA ester lyase, partial [Burkholderiaceae bacterium]|nr:CoA ester lyase [Burkholderiaceae bacterium]
RLVARLINSEENRHGRVGARVHDCDSEFFESDLDLICGKAAQRLAYLVLPKVESVAQVENAISMVNRHCGERSRLPIHILIETHGALGDVRAIAALPQVECLSFGIMDFVSAHHGAIPASAMRSPGQFTHPLVARAKLEISAACHAYGKVPSHSVTTEIKDGAVVADDAKRANAEFGYTRMWSIHPEQIKPIVKAMTPSGTEVDEAAEILRQARAADWGPIKHEGRLHDRASYRYYWSIIQRAKLSGAPMPEAASALLS